MSFIYGRYFTAFFTAALDWCSVSFEIFLETMISQPVSLFFIVPRSEDLSVITLTEPVSFSRQSPNHARKNGDFVPSSE